MLQLVFRFVSIREIHNEYTVKQWLEKISVFYQRSLLESICCRASLTTEVLLTNLSVTHLERRFSHKIYLNLTSDTKYTT